VHVIDERQTLRFELAGGNCFHCVLAITMVILPWSRNGLSPEMRKARCQFRASRALIAGGLLRLT
ncbi:MAG TPA: hypothetical protein VJV22_03200, partial [Acidobacteriaceae bacterium]|nr:hypothetical protein [Acidobacteriaceae bacterium]